MRRDKLLSKALSALLSGAMLFGTIPATAFAEETPLESELEQPLLEDVETTTFDHTYSGYVSLWDESFDDFTSGIGSGWKTKDKDGDGYDWGVALAPGLSHCGDRVLVSDSSYWIQETDEDVPLDPENWLYAPVIELPEGNEYMLTFDAKGNGNTFGVYVAVGTNSTDYVQLGSDYTIAGSEYIDYTIDLSEYAGKYIKLAFVHKSPSGLGSSLYLDCVNISNKPKGYTRVGIHQFENVTFEGDSIVASVPTLFESVDKDGDGCTWETIKSAGIAHTGECYLRSRRKNADVVADNWLLMPRISLAQDYDHLLTFYAMSNFAGQSVDVYVYGNFRFDGNVTPEDLNNDGKEEYYSKVLTQKLDNQGCLNAWTEVKVDLSDYAGCDVYIAIVQSGGQGELRIDDIARWRRDPHADEGDRKKVYSEGFEDNGTALPADWLAEDKDGDGNSWDVLDNTTTRHHYRASARSGAGNGKSNNWLYMPSRTISTTKKTTLTFEAVGSSSRYYDEHFGVYISVDGGEYVQIGKDYTTNFLWQEVEVDLTPYAGKEVRVAIAHRDSYNDQYLFLDCFNIWEETFPPIKKADITLPKPTIGEAVPTTDFSDVKVNVEEYGISVSAFAGKWQKLSKEVFQSGEYSKFEEIADGEKFSKDYVYFLDVPFKIDECYTFADRKDITLTVNGISGYRMDKSPSGNYLRVSITFYPFEAYITDVSATVTEPVVGAVPDTAPVVKFTPDKELLHVAMWFKAPKEDYTTYAETVWEAISDPTEKFAEGYVYAVVIAAANEGMEQYEFTPDTTVSINGKTALPMENDEDGYYMSPALIGGAAVFDLSSTKPENVKASAGDGKVALTWDKVNGATEYVVYFGTGTSLKVYCTTTALGKTVSGLSNGTKYTFLVRAKVGGAWSKFTTEDFVYATPEAPAATKPVVKAVAGDGKVALTWDKVTGATEYVVYVGTGTSIKVYCTTTALGKTVSGLANGTKYTFLVRAKVDGAWTKFTAEDYVYATPTAPAVTKPVVKAVAGDGKVALTWDKVTGATEYVVYVGTGTSLKVYCTTTALGKTVSSLVNGTKYTFLVRAKVDGAWTKFSAEDYVYATPEAVGTVKPVVKAVAGNGKVALTWGTVTGATEYVVYVGTGTSLKVYCTTNALGKTVSSLVNGTKYMFLVRAKVDGAWTKFTAEDYVYATPNA